MPSYVAKSQGKDGTKRSDLQSPAYRPPVENLAPIIPGQPVYLPSHKRHGAKTKVNRGGIQAYNKAYWKLNRLGKLQPEELQNDDAEAEAVKNEPGPKEERRPALKKMKTAPGKDGEGDVGEARAGNED